MMHRRHHLLIIFHNKYSINNTKQSKYTANTSLQPKPFLLALITKVLILKRTVTVDEDKHGDR